MLKEFLNLAIKNLKKLTHKEIRLLLIANEITRAKGVFVCGERCWNLKTNLSID